MGWGEFWIRPDSGQALHSLCGYAGIRAGAYQDVFQLPDEFDYTHGFAGGVRARLRFARPDDGVRPCTRSEVEDWVAYDLAGAVESDVASAIAFVQFYAALFQEFGRGYYVSGFGIAA
jgi:hypothetical protein